MSAAVQENTPVVLVTRGVPSATVQDDDIYLTVPIVAPSLADQTEAIEIFLSVDFARHLIAQLSEAVEAAAKAT